MKLRDLERHLRAHGARQVGEGAKHSKWRGADGERVAAVPRHREIGPGLVRAICAQLEIPLPRVR
ncbi:MAG: type II toxin-antitoxin system HicA family toxin [Chloroflexota bacterium]|nr:type II toxin-antitoxin system HicA family toxin [Chloroflexota bacterium]